MRIDAVGSPECAEFEYDRRGRLVVEQTNGPGLDSYDSTTGAKIVDNAPMPSEGTTTDTLSYYFANAGYLAWAREHDHSVVLTLADGTVVWTLPGAQAGQVGALQRDTRHFWLKTSTQYIEVDLTSGANKVVPQPVFSHPIANHWTWYSDGTLKRNRY